MKKISLLLVLTSLLIAVSCQTSSDLENAFTSNFDENSSLNKSISLEKTRDEVEKVALEVATMLKPTNGLRGAQKLSVSSVYALKDESDLRSLSTSSAADLHVVEFSNNQGYALVAGKQGDAEVLYVSDQGRFDKAFYQDNLERHVQGYTAPWYFTTCPICRGIGTCDPSNCIHSIPPADVCPYKCRSIKECTHQPIRKKGGEDGTIYIHLELTRCNLIRGKENLLKTNWHLRGPFNLFAPLVKWRDKDTGVEYEDRAFIGCNTVALMQMMAYHQFPKILGGDTMPWERFREMDKFEGEDKTLIARASKYVADEIESIYGYDNSQETVAYYSDVEKFLMKVGYKDYIDQPYTLGAVMDELDQNRPLFIRASRKGASAGHIWILDGYKEMMYTKYSNKGAKTQVYNFVHCNWGWGVNDGYCLSNVFYSKEEYKDIETIQPEIKVVPNGKAYSENCRIYIGIEPKG